MEAIEYLRGEENQELNNVIILIVKEFLNISEKEAEEVCRSIIKKEIEAEINPQLVEKDVHKINVILENSNENEEEKTEIEIEDNNDKQFEKTKELFANETEDIDTEIDNDKNIDEDIEEYSEEEYQDDLEKLGIEDIQLEKDEEKEETPKESNEKLVVRSPIGVKKGSYCVNPNPAESAFGTDTVDDSYAEHGYMADIAFENCVINSGGSVKHTGPVTITVSLAEEKNYDAVMNRDKWYLENGQINRISGRDSSFLYFNGWLMYKQSN